VQPSRAPKTLKSTITPQRPSSMHNDPSPQKRLPKPTFPHDCPPPTTPHAHFPASTLEPPETPTKCVFCVTSTVYPTTPLQPESYPYPRSFARCIDCGAWYTIRLRQGLKVSIQLHRIH